MKWSFFLSIILVVLTACTGQKPASMKNSTVSKRPVSAECSTISFDGEVLTKENVLKIFSCSGWAKQYPALTEKIAAADSVKINHALRIFNQELVSNKTQRKSFFSFISQSEASGKLPKVSLLLEKSFGEHKLLSQLSRVMNLSLQQKKTKNLLQMISADNNQNIKNLKSLKNVVNAYEDNRQDLNMILAEDEDDKFQERLLTLADDLSFLETKNWNYLAQMIYGNGSALKEWSVEGLDADVTPLLNIIENPEFVFNMRYLNNSIERGIPCHNSANKNDFNVYVKQELKHKIESLKNDSAEKFELTILHGLSKYMAFHDFCQEGKAKQGLDSFYGTLNAAFSIIPSAHDFSFLKKIHNIFGEDRFVLLKFLSSQNFKQWDDLFILLKSKDLDVNFVKTLYSMLASVKDEDLKVISDWAMEIQNPDSQTSRWVSAWSDVWAQLSKEEKQEFIKYLGLLSKEDISLVSLVSLTTDLMQIFPELSSHLAEALSDESYQNDLAYLLEVLGDEKAEKELAHFFSSDGLFEFLRIMTQQNEKKPITARADALTLAYIARPTVEHKKNKTELCFQSLTEAYEKDSSYHMLVINLPDNCRSVLAEAGFVGQIYLWMNNSHHYFKNERQVDDFHASAGVWSPPMLHFIFTAAIQADRTLRSANGLGIRANIDAIHKTVTNPDLLETFHQFSEVFIEAVSDISFDQRLNKYLQKLTNEDMLNFGKSFFVLVDDVNEPRTEVNIRPTSCKDLDPNMGAQNCLSNSEITKGVLDILRISTKKNEEGKSLIKELVRWLHPEGKIPLPFNSKKPTFTYNADLEEVIRFAHDLSSPKTQEDFSFNNGTVVKELKGTTFDRLEVVMREISFTNNFYGAYFKNDVAGFKSYRKDMIKAKKLLNWLDRLGGVMRKTGSLPIETAWKLDNVRNTFWSLVEVSDEYHQPDGSVKTYNNLIQSLLASVATSSPLKTQDFNAYRLPKGGIVDGHNGLFMTRMVEVSGLRHLGRFVHSRFGDLSSLKTPEFQQVNKNLIGRYKLNVIQDELQRILETYLYHDRDQINLIIEDAISFISTLDENQQKKLESLLLKGVLIMSDKSIPEERIFQGAKGFEMMIKMWPEIREILKGIKNPSKLLGLADDLMEKILHDKSEKSFMAFVMESELIELSEVENLLGKKDFRFKVIEMFNQFLSMNIESDGLNWIETLKQIAVSETMKWDPVKAWLSHAVSPGEKNLTLTLLIQVLGEKNAEGYRLKTVMDELFVNHRDHLNQFLDETFPSLQIISD